MGSSSTAVIISPSASKAPVSTGSNEVAVVVESTVDAVDQFLATVPIKLLPDVDDAMGGTISA